MPLRYVHTPWVPAYLTAALLFGILTKYSKLSEMQKIKFRICCSTVLRPIRLIWLARKNEHLSSSPTKRKIMSGLMKITGLFVST